MKRSKSSTAAEVLPQVASDLVPAIAWFESRGWEPFSFQREAWRAYLEGRSGLVNAPTGMGKTYSLWMGPILQWIAENPEVERVSWGRGETDDSLRLRTAAKSRLTRASKPSRRIPKPASKAQPIVVPAAEAGLRVLDRKFARSGAASPITCLWITPLRALAKDTHQALLAPVADLGLPWTVELRTGDSSASEKTRQKRRLPTVLITTPESLSVLLSYEDTAEQLRTLRCIVCDEWHELLGSKRGTQTELCLARLRKCAPKVQTWGLSATLGNLEQALEVLCGYSRAPILGAADGMDCNLRSQSLDFKPVDPWKASRLKVTNRDLPHLEVPAATYFVTVRNWKQMQLGPADRDIALQAIKFWHGSRIRLISAVVMPDHWHALFQINDGSSLGEIVGSIKRSSARAINRQRSSSGPVWQREWFDHIVRDLHDLEKQRNYIARNPIEAGLVHESEKYSWLVDGLTDESTHDNKQLPDLGEAQPVSGPENRGPTNAPATSPILIRVPDIKQTEAITLLPEHIERFPWVGHIGTKLLPNVIRAIESARTTLLFTNVRSGAEIWYRALEMARPDLAPGMGIHHGSLDREYREAVENRLRDGSIRCVVCTSSLDLGVDFPAVDQVIQVGSPKGVARLKQRAGRSGHQPGGISRILCVPTHAFELVEYAAVKTAISQSDSSKPIVESRVPLDRPLDVLVQHMVTLALGGGFLAEELLEEVRTAYSYRGLSEEEYCWCLDFITKGGKALRAYSQFRRVEIDDETRVHIVRSPMIAKFHRLAIGTIVADNTVTIKMHSGPTLGTVEESFMSRIPPGGRFVFAGRTLELLRMREMVAIVKKATVTSGYIPRWMGAKMPWSMQLASLVRTKLEEAREGNYSGAEMEAVKTILEIQRRWSRIPGSDELLMELIEEEKLFHAFIYPFEGRGVHEGLGALVAHRVARVRPRTITVMVNDYGFELLCVEPLDLTSDEWRKVLSTERLTEDLLECLNSSELARRQFREIARVAGLIFSGYPGAPKSARQVQSSSGLLFDVFNRFDPENLLLEQAKREVLDRQLEVQRLRRCLERLEYLPLRIERPRRLTPLAFPLWAAFVETEVSSEQWTERVQRMVLSLEEEAENRN